MRTGVLIASLALLAACNERRTPAPPPPPADTRPTEAPPVPAEPAEGPPAPPIDELSEPELEAACFRGRQEACDRLGH